MKRLKQLICLLALFTAAIILFPSTAKAAGDVKIDATNFPDTKFRTCVKAFDKNKDGKFSTSELEAVKTMDVSGKGIKSLKGLEHFKKLETLDCSNNSLTELETPVLLDNLYCQGNNIKYLNIDTTNLIEAYYGDGLGE